MGLAGFSDMGMLLGLSQRAMARSYSIELGKQSFTPASSLADATAFTMGVDSFSRGWWQGVIAGNGILIIPQQVKLVLKVGELSWVLFSA